MVTADVKVYKAYASKRNKERYLKRKRDEYTSISLDDENCFFIFKSDVDVEAEVEKNLNIELLREAVTKLPKSERKLIKEYFFDNVPLRTLAKKYGVSHTFINGKIENILDKLKEYILNK